MLNKLALITVWKDGALKHRLILDCRVSGTNSTTRKFERVVLPRIGDLIRDALRLKAQKGPGQELTWLVIDFVDAFFKVPLAHSEQHYFGAWYDGEVYIWARVGQGSQDGPTLYGRLAALTGRLSQSVVDIAGALIQLYTDDPI